MTVASTVTEGVLWACEAKSKLRLSRLHRHASAFGQHCTRFRVRLAVDDVRQAFSLDSRRDQRRFITAIVVVECTALDYFGAVLDEAVCAVLFSSVTSHCPLTPARSSLPGPPPPVPPDLVSPDPPLLQAAQTSFA